jgi:hypothetical protein
MLATITKIVLAALLTWAPLKDHVGEPPEEVQARYDSTAGDIAAVALESTETPLFSTSDGRIRTALVLANIATLEGHLWKFVDLGWCNDKTRKPDPRGNCDGGHAYTFWQIHPDQLPMGDHATGKELLASRQLAARIALHIVRISLSRTRSKTDTIGSLCMYTGEPCAMRQHPLAEERLQRALKYATELHLDVGALEKVGETASRE